MTDSIIKLKNVDFFYDKGLPSEVHALRDISLGINRGEYISFFGPSGCGKSTLLYMIAGIDLPESGRVIINGQNLLDYSQRELAIYRQIGIGIIFQNFNLIPSVKNLDNVTLPMAFLGISPEKRRERAIEIFNRLGIANLADRYPHELSGGQQQRVAIARAMANDPPIILADEPLGNLDSENAKNVLNLLKEFNEEDKKTIIMVTHEAWSLRDVDRIFYMKDGAVNRVESRKKVEENVKKVGAGHYYKKLFPKIPLIEERSKIISAAVLRGFPQPEIKRMEYFLNQRFRNQIDSDLLEKVLDRPYSKGGVGLWKQKAKKIAAYVERIIKEEKELYEVYKKLERNPEAPLYDEVERVRKWLLEGSRLKLSPLQTNRMDEIIGERVRNIITTEHFQKILDLPKDRGGIGLRISTSLKMAEKLNVILGRA